MTAGDREDEQARVVEIGAEEDVAAVEIDHADEVDLQAQDRRVLRRQHRPQHADDGEHRVRQIEQQAELHRDDRRRAPAELRHRPDDEVILLRREELLDVADDARDVRDDVLRETGCS